MSDFAIYTIKKMWDANIHLYSSRFFLKMDFFVVNLHLLPKRVFLEVSYGNSFLIALGLRVEMRIIRLRRSSAGWPCVPDAEEERCYVGWCRLQVSLVLPNSYRPAVINLSMLASFSWTNLSRWILVAALRMSLYSAAYKSNQVFCPFCYSFPQCLIGHFSF